MNAHKVLVRGAIAQTTSVFSSTDWDIDQSTLKARTVCAFKSTDWGDDAPAIKYVIGFSGIEDNWT